MVDSVTICPHCGADAMESASCAMNGCPFGVDEPNVTHSSDCATHSGPAFDTTHSRCDCGALPSYLQQVGPDNPSGAGGNK